MKALIVGGSGFLGGAVARHLSAAGWEIIVLRTSPTAAPGILTGDVRQSDLGLSVRSLSTLRDGLTHIVSCFGSVDWTTGPALVELHETGTRRILDFAESCSELQRLVHVSSILALGKSDQPVDNATLDIGQQFRSWYEYAKFRAELVSWERANLPIRTVRFGPLLGTSEGRTASARAGVLAAVPALLRGYPLHLTDHGAFPCYAVDVEAAAGVVRHALCDDKNDRVWTFYERHGPTLASVLTAVCAAWSVMPRIIEFKPIGLLTKALGARLGIPAALHAYANPWVDIAPRVLDELPHDLPSSRAGYLHATGEALRLQYQSAPAL